MSKTTTTATRALAALAAVSALAAGVAAPQAAAAQPYGYSGQAYGGAYYDPCRRDQSNRGIGGALIGGGLGAVVGSQMAASGHRTDGSVLGGALGALAGAAVGSRSSACAPGSQYYGAPPPPPPPQAYYEGPRYREAPAYRYDGRYDGRYGDEDRWAYGQRGERLRVVERAPGADGCTLAESPIYMPDGRVQKRFVRVCADRNGRYQVVD
jgi:hypothetical protein